MEVDVVLVTSNSIFSISLMDILFLICMQAYIFVKNNFKQILGFTEFIVYISCILIGATLLIVLFCVFFITCFDGISLLLAKSR